MIEHSDHFGFIIAAYGVAAVVIAAMIVATIADYRSLKAALARFGRRDYTAGQDRE